MFEDVLGADAGRFLIAILGVGAALLLLLGIMWFLRGRNGPSPFVRGGKNRQPRLQVLDAAAVDARRRLVLIRRDDVEHLVMIGGPTDIVIESRIGQAPSAQQMEIAPVQRLAPADPRPALPAAEARIAPPQEPSRPLPVQRPAIPEPRVEPVREAPVARDVPRAAVQPAPVAVPSVVAANDPAMSVRPAAPEPVATPRPEALVRPAPEVKPEPLRPIAALAAKTAAPRPSENSTALDDVASVLDAARGRVLSDVPETKPAQPAPVQQSAPTQPVAAAPTPLATERPKQLGTDFERILQEEMAQNLASRDLTMANQASQQTQQRRLPQRDPAAPPVAGATREPTLQAEVARIFGEMSAGN